MKPAAASLVLAGSCLLGATARAGQSPTYHRDVQPILAAHCARCHQDGGGAPMPLVDYEQVRPWAESIEREVTSGRMPPWFASPHVGRFSNDARLDAAEREALLAWVEAGAPRGTPQPPASFPKVADGWRIGEPDLVVEMPEPFDVPASGEVDYVYVRVPLPNQADRWVRAVEVLPGEPDVIHHVDIFVCPRNCRDFEGLTPGVPSFLPRTPPSEPPVQNDVGDFFGLEIELLYSYLPGGDAWVLPAERARLLPGGGELLFNLHYTPNGTAARDRSRVGIVFHDAEPRERVLTLGVDNESLVIPAGESHHAARAELLVAEEMTLRALTPHMHLRGRSFRFDAMLPEGARRRLLDVPDWDFNWQLTYVLDEPLRLQRGSRLQLTAAFDNSRGNRFNPDPSRDVLWGRQVTDEMMTAWIEVSFPVDVDPTTLLVGEETP